MRTRFASAFFIAFLLSNPLIAQPDSGSDLELVDVRSAPAEHRNSPFQIHIGGFSALPRAMDNADKLRVIREIATLRSQSASLHLLAQFTEVLTPPKLKEFRDLGLTIGPSVGRGTYTASIGKDRAGQLLELETLRWFGLVPLQMKAASVLNAEGQPRQPLSYQLSGDRRIRYSVKFHDLATSRDIETLLENLSASIVNPKDPPEVSRTVDIPYDALIRLIRSDLVYRIRPGPAPVLPQNATTRGTVRATIAETVDGLTGDGITVGVWEANEDDSAAPDQPVAEVYGGHRDLNPRSTTAPLNSTRDSNHATMVAGVIASDDRNDGARGMAPDAEIWSFDLIDQYEEMRLTAIATPNMIGLTRLKISNHSYGPRIGWTRSGARWEFEDNLGDFGDYDGGENEFKDGLVRSTGTVMVFSAGNHGDEVGRGRNDVGDCFQVFSNFKSNCIGPYSAGKNVLSVGALKRDNTIADFSSVGPSADGRIKPDLVAPGQGVISTKRHSSVLGFGCKDECYSGRLSRGTSFSAPAVAGVIALLMEKAQSMGLGALPAAFYRGLLAHTAEDLGPTGPDFTYGWGLVRADRAIDAMELHGGKAIALKNVGNQFAAPAMQTCYFEAPSNPFRVTLAWDDRGGSGLQNDLSLRVFNPDNTRVLLPWVLDPSSPQTPATTGADAKHTLEIVDVPASELMPGLWRAEVSINSMVMEPVQTYALIGPLCDNDIDDDMVTNDVDNCLTTPNPMQVNTDGDADGDACDEDLDNDGWENAADNCPSVVNPLQTNTDGDAAGDACDRDDDNDCVADEDDTCPRVANCNYYGEKATRGLCTDPCLSTSVPGVYRGKAFRDTVVEVYGMPVYREFAAELGMVIHYCRAELEVPIEPSCFTTGCPLPEFLVDGFDETLTAFAREIDGRRTGIEFLDNGNVILPSAASGLLTGKSVNHLMLRHSSFSQTLRTVIESEIGRDNLEEVIAEERREADLPPPQGDQQLMMMSLRSSNPDVRTPLCAGLINDLQEGAFQAEQRAQITYNSCRRPLEEAAEMCMKETVSCR